MTLEASISTVCRTCDLIGVNVEGNLLSVFLYLEVRVAMTRQALAVGKALGIEDPPNNVWLMAIDTDRQLMRLFFPELAFDNLHVHFFYLRVTLHAGRSNVSLMDGRPGVLVRKDVVRFVAAGTHGCYGQSAPEQPVAVDRLRVVFQDIVLADLTQFRYERTFLVTRPTEIRDVHDECGRPLIRRRPHIMLAMA
jgi:hypothetical protein